MLLIDGNVCLTTCYVQVGIWSCHVFKYFSPSLRINHVVVMQKTGKNINKVLFKILRKNGVNLFVDLLKPGPNKDDTDSKEILMKTL